MHNYKFYEVKEENIRIVNSRGTWMVAFYVSSGKYLEYIQSMFMSVYLRFCGARVCGRQLMVYSVERNIMSKISEARKYVMFLQKEVEFNIPSVVRKI